MEWQPHFDGGNTGKTGFFPAWEGKKRADLFLPEVDIDDADLGRVAELDRYEFCGHGVILGKQQKDWQNVDKLLGMFGKASLSLYP
jgi:hypothetical protein